MTYAKERLDIIANPKSDRIKRVAGLSRRSARQRNGLILVEGPQAVRELVTHRGKFIRDVYISEDAWERHQDIVEAAQRVTRWVHPITTEVADTISDACQGIAAVATSDVIGARLDQIPNLKSVVIMTDTQDPGNAGTIIRTADACGIDAIVACPGGVDVTSPKVIRASAGSIFHLPIVTRLPLDKAIDVIHGLDGVVLSTDTEAHVTLDDLINDDHPDAILRNLVAWVMGNEARGLSEDQVMSTDMAVSIPMYGRAESLNVAIAAALCLYATARAQHSD